MSNKLQKQILKIAKKLPPSAATTLVKKYEETPFVIREALDNFYSNLEQLTGIETVESVRTALNKLKQVCDANPSYQDVYEAALAEAKKVVSKGIANSDISIFGN